MRRLSKFIPESAMLNIYYSLFYPHLNYGILAWGKSSIQNSRKLTSIQKRAWKLLKKNDPTQRLLNCESVYKYFVAVKTYKAIIFKEHSYFTDKFQSYIPSHSYNTRARDRNDLNTPFFRTSKGQNSFIYQAVQTWNDIPAKTRKTNTTFSEFKNSLKDYLISSQA